MGFYQKVYTTIKEQGLNNICVNQFCFKINLVGSEMVWLMKEKDAYSEEKMAST